VVGIACRKTTTAKRSGAETPAFGGFYFSSSAEKGTLWGSEA
jgi:hypothetical protein